MSGMITNFVNGAGTIINIMPPSGMVTIIPSFPRLSDYDAMCNDWYLVGGHLQSAFHDTLLDHGYEEQTAQQVFEAAPVYY